MTRLASASSILCAGGTAAVNVPFANIVTSATFVREYSNPNPYTQNPYDYFGAFVGINDNFIITTAMGEQDNSSASSDASGKAYLFSLANTSLMYTLKNPNAWSVPGYDYFGGALSVNGNTVAVAAIYEGDASSPDGYSGKVYVYDSGTLSGAPATITTANKAVLSNPNPKGNSYFDLFGSAIAVGGDVIVAGAANEGGNTAGDYAGRAYVYNTSGGYLYTLQDPNAYGTANSDQFGTRVVVSNTMIAVGTPYENDASGLQSGKVYVFRPSDGTLLYTLNNPNPYGTSNTDYFGGVVVVTDRYVVVQSQEDVIGTNDRLVYVYDTLTFPAAPATISSPTYTLVNPTQSTGYFGDAIAANGDILAVSAYGAPDLAGNANAGRVYLYNFRNMASASGNVTPTTVIQNPQSHSGQWFSVGFGYSLAMTSNTLAVGIQNQNPNSAIALYTLSV